MEILFSFKYSGFHVLWKCLKPLVYNPITDTDSLLFSKKTRRYLLACDKLNKSKSMIQVPSDYHNQELTYNLVFIKENIILLNS